MPIISADEAVVAGVASVAKAGDPAITGAVTLSAGSGITLTEVGNDIAIAATAVGNAVVRGPFLFSFATANLNTGVAFYTPAVGDILLDAWISVLTAWNGTTPKADLGQFTAEVVGWFASTSDPTFLDTPDQNDIGAGLLGSGPTETGIMQTQYSLPSPLRNVPGKFLAAAPIKVVVSQDGKQGGAATGSTAGTAAAYLITATPVPLP